MPTALHITGLPSQSSQGVGARLVRRLGGAVRSVIVRGITLAGTLRRPAAPQTGCHDPEAQASQASAPTPLRVSCRPRPALPAPLLPPPLLAHLLAARRHHRPAATSRPAFLNRGDKPFTPEAFPQLSPKACAVLNTPLKDCDPKTIELLVSALAQHISYVMSPETGITDPAAAFPNLWHRINAALAETQADTSLPATPQAAPATPADAMSDAPVASPHPPAPPTAPTKLCTNDAPRPSPLPLSGPPASDQPPDPTITTAAPETTAVGHAGPPPSNSGRPLRGRTKYFARWRRRPLRCGRPLFPPGLRDALQRAPPCRPCYPTCTGPPRAIARPTRHTSEPNVTGPPPGGPASSRVSSSPKSTPLSPFLPARGQARTGTLSAARLNPPAAPPARSPASAAK